MTNFETVFFDLDATLYPASNGLWAAIRDRIELYMRKRLELSEEKIATIRESYYLRYGTTLKGLQANFGVDRRPIISISSTTCPWTIICNPTPT